MTCAAASTAPDDSSASWSTRPNRKKAFCLHMSQPLCFPHTHLVLAFTSPIHSPGACHSTHLYTLTGCFSPPHPYTLTGVLFFSISHNQAHHASALNGDHAYAGIARQLRERGHRFRLLALSATPGATLGAVQRVVDALRIEVAFFFFSFCFWGESSTFRCPTFRCPTGSHAPRFPPTMGTCPASPPPHTPHPIPYTAHAVPSISQPIPSNVSRPRPTCHTRSFLHASHAILPELITVFWMFGRAARRGARDRRRRAPRTRARPPRSRRAHAVRFGPRRLHRRERAAEHPRAGEKKIFLEKKALTTCFKKSLTAPPSPPIDSSPHMPNTPPI